MSSAKITVRERIAPEITASLFANYRSSADAVMELVDNAIDSRLPKSPLTVEITVHPQSLVVTAAGGEGMGIREIERNYLRWGGSPKRGRQLLGQYGQGGKAAIGHLGRRFTVEASRPGDQVAWRFTDDDYRDRSRLKTYELIETPKRTPVEIGYVRIRIDGIDKRIDVRRLAQRLAETYRPLLERRELELTLDRLEVRPTPLPLAERHAFAINTGGARLRGWVGLSDPVQPAGGWVPGIRCYRLGRLIADGEFFGHPGPATLPAMVRLMGEVDVPNVALTMNKTDFDRDSQSWVAVEARMHKLLASWVRRLERDVEIPPPSSAIKVAEQVRKLLSQALRLSDRQDLFAGFAPARPSAKQRDALELPFEAPRTVPAGQEPQTPIPSPSPPDAPPEARKRGFGIIAVRPLDPRVRSMTVLEDGVRTVVINSRYPLFLERRGDVWYQLETAVREVCKAAEGANVAEYEKRVNDILLTALQLRASRRRRPASGRQLRLVQG
jgi:Histidine kinase-, DNA gyrase B-, and HSP90-like ATPase